MGETEDITDEVADGSTCHGGYRERERGRERKRPKTSLMRLPMAAQAMVDTVIIAPMCVSIACLSRVACHQSGVRQRGVH